MYKKNICPACLSPTWFLPEFLMPQDIQYVNQWKLCPLHQKYIDDGMLLLIGVDEEALQTKDEINIDTIADCRTGKICFVDEHVYGQLSDDPIPKGKITIASDKTIEAFEQISKALAKLCVNELENDLFDNLDQ